MTDDKFWDFIEKSKSGWFHSRKAQKAKLKNLLSKLSVEDVIAFDRIFVERLFASYTWDLWGAAYLINGGCSDDSFEYFRRGLIASGRQKYEKALEDPESLAAWVKPNNLEFEDFKHVAYDVYNEKTGTTGIPNHGLRYPSSPTGDEWAEDSDDLEKRFPKLWSKFGG